jgi:hypothetical protein
MKKFEKFIDTYGKYLVLASFALNPNSVNPATIKEFIDNH